jgi:hypothetical protein
LTVVFFSSLIIMQDPVDPLGGLQSLVSDEARKPLASAVDALASPWIARLRRWATDRELQRRLEDPDLPSAFASYARRLDKRVSFLSTLVARDPLPFSVVYEPLWLISLLNREVVWGWELRREGARSFVVDDAGMGKSTYARHLVVEALKAEDLVPVLLELRRVEKGVSLKEAIAREFDDLDRQFERDLLLRLFRDGRFLFVLDGLDEVPTEQRQTLIIEIEELASGAEHSAIVLTSRPEAARPTIGGLQSLMIRPLHQHESESLVCRYDKALGGLDLGQRLISEFSLVPSRFLEIPLLVALLYRTYGYTRSISARISIFYDELYNALYKGHDLTKSGFVRPKASGLDVAEFRRLLRGFAFLVIMREKVSMRGDAEAQRFATDASHLTAVTPNSPAAFIEDLLSAVPLLVRDGLELRFVHKSVAEFFAAEYFAMGTPDGVQLIAEILSSPLNSRLTAVFDFLADIDPPLFQRAALAPFAEMVGLHSLAESHPLLWTLDCLGDVSIGIWPVSELRDPSSEQAEPYSQWRGSVGSQWYFFRAALKPRPSPHPSIWTKLTEVTADHPGRPLDNFEAFFHELPTKTWLPITDPRVANAAQVEEFRGVLAMLVGHMQPRSGGRRPDHIEPVRVLSASRVREAIESAHADRSALQLVRQLLGPPASDTSIE